MSNDIDNTTDQPESNNSSGGKLKGSTSLWKATKAWIFPNGIIWVVVLVILIVITVLAGKVKNDICPNTDSLEWFKWIFGIGIAISCAWGILYPVGSIWLSMRRLKDE